jgi:hypothetical protein
MTNHLRLMSFPLGMVVPWDVPMLLIVRCTPWFCCLRLDGSVVREEGETAEVDAGGMAVCAE